MKKKKNQLEEEEEGPDWNPRDGVGSKCDTRLRLVRHKTSAAWHVNFVTPLAHHYVTRYRLSLGEVAMKALLLCPLRLSAYLLSAQLFL